MVSASRGGPGVLEITPCLFLGKATFFLLDRAISSCFVLLGRGLEEVHLVFTIHPFVYEKVRSFDSVDTRN